LSYKCEEVRFTYSRWQNLERFVCPPRLLDCCMQVRIHVKPFVASSSCRSEQRTKKEKESKEQNLRILSQDGENMASPHLVEVYYKERE